MNLARRIELLLFMVVVISVGLAYLGQLAVLACFDRIEREKRGTRHAAVYRRDQTGSPPP